MSFVDGKHSTGYQLLHLVFIVETFLRDLIKRRCNFHVVFFEGHRIVSCGVDEGDGTIRMHPARCFARSVIIRHLQALDDLEVFVFGDARDVEWERYLSSQLVSCRLMVFHLSDLPRLNVTIAGIAPLRYVQRWIMPAA